MNERVESYFASLRGKRTAVLGIGVSNRPLVRMLLEHGIEVTACDRTERERLDAEVLELERMGAKLRLGENYLEGVEADVVFRTPGMHPEHPSLQKLLSGGAVLTSEMEAFFAVCPCRILAVTGSDGKTTTTTILAKMLEQAGHRVWLGGNIGAPLLPQAPDMEPDDLAVVELSSFQLLTMRQSADIAVVTNLAPNHLDMHRDMDEYVRAKKNVFLHQSGQGKVVLNLDNAITRSFAAEAPGTVEFFSRTQRTQGAYEENGTVYYAGEPVMEVSDILLPGVHNLENYLAAICAAAGLASFEDMREVARSFTGVEHRCERVRELRGVTYYNDSIASSPSRTIAGLRSFDRKVLLIAGGYDKHIPFDVLGPEVCRGVKLLVLCGATSEKIRAAVENAPDYRPGQPEIVEVSSLPEAVAVCAERAQSGDIVTLSPACAAFDQFKNFMERGKTYKKLVMDLP